MPAVATSLLVLAAALLMMLLEAQLSAHNERRLRTQGALEPADDVIGWMRVAYPLAFVLIAVEGALHHWLRPDRVLWGLAIFTLAKALKFWAIASLGPRWSFKVLVLPGAPLVTRGPYRVLRHPNYVAVVLELVGMALTVTAPITGALAVAGFGWLMLRRIAIEERALGLRG